MVIQLGILPLIPPFLVWSAITAGGALYLGVDDIIAGWLFSLKKTVTSKGLAPFQEPSAFVSSLSSKLTKQEAVNLLAYLSKLPSNFDLYWSAWQKMTPAERSTLQSIVVTYANHIPVASADWQNKLINDYCTKNPGGCGYSTGSTVGGDDSRKLAGDAAMEAKKKAEECSDWDIGCKLEKTVKSVVKVTALVGMGYVLYRVFK